MLLDSSARAYPTQPLIFDWQIRHPLSVYDAMPIPPWGTVYNFEPDAPGDIIPLPFPNVYTDPTLDWELQPGHTYPVIIAEGWPVSVMMMDDTMGPYDDSGSVPWQPETLAKLMAALDNVDADGPGPDLMLNAPLEYVLSDAEGPNAWDNLEHMIDQVRTNAFHSGAKIGAYQRHPGVMQWAQVWPAAVSQPDWHAFYIDNDFDIAMPTVYPYSSYGNHTQDGIWGPNGSWTGPPLYGSGDFTSPNIRAAIFWAPLEHGSLALREIPAGDIVIPWVGGYAYECGYPPYQPPPKPDMAALLKHLRLRGIAGYGLFNSGLQYWPNPPCCCPTPPTNPACCTQDPVPPESCCALGTCSCCYCCADIDVLCQPGEFQPYSDDQFRVDMHDAWTSLDITLQAGTPPAGPIPLRKTTNKNWGVQASAMVSGTNYTKITVLISNLRDETAVQVKLPNHSGLPSTVSVRCNQHFQQTYTVPPVNPASLPVWLDRRPGDLNWDGAINGADLAVLIAAWGACPTPRCTFPCPADLDFDGDVDDKDEAILMENWTG